MFENVNELAVVVSAILSVAVGSIWYSPLLFGKQWMQSAGLTVADEDLTTKEAILVTGKNVLTHVVLFYVVSQFIVLARAQSVSLSLLGALLAVFLTAYLISIAVWEKKSLTYLLIHAGYGALALTGGISVIAFWPW